MNSDFPAPPPMTPPAEEGSNEDDAPARARDRVWLRRIRQGGWLALILGLLGAGFSLGVRFASDEPEEFTVAVTGEASGRTKDTTAELGTDRVLPDVVGLPLADALATLAGTGLSDQDVNVTRQPRAGASDTVVSQSPQPGATDASKVELVVSDPVPIPEVLGKTEREATQTLEALGARVRIERAFAAGKPVGSVYEVEPAVGETAPAEITLRVAAAGSAISLAELEEVENDCSSDEVSINGQTYTAGLSCRLYPTTTYVAAYTLGRDFEQFKATLGLDDSSDTGTTVKFRIKADDRVVAERQVSFGRATPVEVDVHGALRLTIEIEAIGSEDDDRIFIAALGEPQVLGSPEAVEEYRKKKS